MATPPIYNPVIPFTMGLAMQPGLMMHLQGKPTGSGFHINLKAGLEADADIALNFNPRFSPENIIVRNTYSKGRWGVEERRISSFPFSLGEHFEIVILSQEHQFKVAVNGCHLLEYEHRIPVRSVKYLIVEDAVVLTTVRTSVEFPSKARPPKLFKNPGVPLSATVPFSNLKGHKIVINGIPLDQEPRKFTFDLRGAPPDNDIYMHMDSRFAQRRIVRNSMLRGKWGGEERQLAIPFPFYPGVPYKIAIHVEEQSFRVVLNGMEIFRFNHRKRPLTLIGQVDFHGSTDISCVKFK